MISYNEQKAASCQAGTVVKVLFDFFDWSDNLLFTNFTEVTNSQLSNYKILEKIFESKSQKI